MPSSLCSPVEQDATESRLSAKEMGRLRSASTPRSRCPARSHGGHGQWLTSFSSAMPRTIAQSQKAFANKYRNAEFRARWRVAMQGLACSAGKAPARLPMNQSMVPVEGIEPPLCCQKQILSLPRLPIPPHRHRCRADRKAGAGRGGEYSRKRDGAKWIAAVRNRGVTVVAPPAASGPARVAGVNGWRRRLPRRARQIGDQCV